MRTGINNEVIKKKKNLFDDDDQDIERTAKNKESAKATTQLKINNGIAEEMDIVIKSFAHGWL